MERHSFHHHHHNHLRCSSQQLENIVEEDGTPKGGLRSSLRPPETPTETMEFLARSWSLSATELSKALADIFLQPPSIAKTTPASTTDQKPNHSESLSAPAAIEPKKTALQLSVTAATDSAGWTPPISPRDSGDVKLLRGMQPRGKTAAGWRRDHKEKRKAEARSHNAQIYAAASVAGVAAAVAALAASNVFATPQPSNDGGASKTGAAIASAAALVASHCIETARAMGASHDQILTMIRSAVGAQTSGDIMALTAGAATALRGAATLQARLQKDVHGVTTSTENNVSDGFASALTFISKGGELLKRTRKGVLHWKQVSVYMNSNWQVVLKMKSTHMAGAFVKKKKSVILSVNSDVPAWPGREAEDGSNHRAYFGIRTAERLIEFECRDKCDKQMWIEGIRQMLNCHAHMNANVNQSTN